MAGARVGVLALAWEGEIAGSEIDREGGREIGGRGREGDRQSACEAPPSAHLAA